MNQHAAPPEFAMSFTHEAVLLEQREGPNWRPLGEAPFSGREMAATLNALRDEAGGTAGELDTVLVIPDDQILYTTLAVPYGENTEDVIGRALEGMTPYKADELAFDWCPALDGSIETLRIAAVARRTLHEAEDFARAQGFRPLGFAARPEDDRFHGDPDFGPSRLAEEQFTSTPFSEPDLTHARVTAPDLTDQPETVEQTVVEVASEAPASVEVPSVVQQAAVQQEVVSEKAAAPVVSRIVPHHYLAPIVATPAAASGPSPLEVAVSAKPEASPAPVTDTPVEEAVEAEEGETKVEPRGVIRHGQPKLSPVSGLSPRAQAVHSRASEAKARRGRAEPAAEVAAPGLMTRLRNLDPARLPTMIGALAVLLVIVLFAFGGRNQSEQVAQPTDNTPADATVIPEPNDSLATASNEEQPADDTASAQTSGTDVEAAQDVADAAAPLEAATPATGAPDTTAAEAADPALNQTETAAQSVDPRDLAAASTAAGAVATAPAATTTPLVGSRPPLARPTTSQQATAPAAPEATRSAAQVALGNDTLSRALTDAMAQRDAQIAAREAVSAATMAGNLATAPRAPQPAAAQNTAPRARQAAPARSRPQLARSVRPPRAVTTRTAATPVAARANADTRPAVPANPQPYAQRTQPEVARPASGHRPPSRPATRASQAVVPAATPAAAQVRPSAQANRPPARPDRHSQLEEGSTSEEGEPSRLTSAEKTHLEGLLRDLRTAQIGNSGLSTAERGALIQLADARPTRRPVAVGGPSQQAVRDAIASATESDRPETRSSHAAAPSTTSSQSAGLGRSSRPASRPGNRAVAASGPGPGNASLSSGAVENAIAAAVSETSSGSGAVALTALNSSALPPRRAARAAANTTLAALAPVASDAPTAEDLRAAAEAQNSAASEEQRRQDAELQAQAEARARAHAAADAQAEAQARAAAEARARAQAEAEAQAARRRQQTYRPPEAEEEPDVASANIPDGRTPTTAGNAATVQRGIQVNRTQIIGTIGAGRASRALIRLSNGRILTLRIGDKINGGTISEIGDSRITYVKGGRAQQLSVLGGQ